MWSLRIPVTQLAVEGNKADTDLISVENKREEKLKSSIRKLNQLSI